MADFDELLRRLGEVSDLRRAGYLLGWDQETKMPPLGAPARAEQLATLARLAHDRATAPELGELLEGLRALEEGSEPESFEASVIRVARRDFEKQRRVPSDLRAEMTRAGSLGYVSWLEAREAGDYEMFRPHLERRLDLAREYVACHEPFDDPYDPLLDDHEPGMKTAHVASVFARLKDVLVPLVAGVGEPVDDSCLHGDFSPERQREFSLEMLSRWGMDDQAWRLDDTVHPFAMGMSESDIRLTTRFDQDNLGGLMSCLHEFGHGIYERQVDARYLRTPLQEGTSSGFHESQSRLWENVVGRSLSTWSFFYPRLQETFPEQLGAVPLDEFHRALNRVAPGVIRVDADEVTYSLHIVLRFELERGMLSGAVTPADLPDAFDAKLREYLVSSRRTSSRVSCRTSTGRTPTSATSRPTRSAMSSRSSSGSARRRARRSRRRVPEGRVRLAARVAARARSPLGPRLRAGGAARAGRRRAARRRALPRLSPGQGCGARLGMSSGTTALR